MIGFIVGEVLFSDGHEIIVRTESGIGYQLHFNHVLIEGSKAALFVAQIIKEDGHYLYGFYSLRAKKMFELLLTVKGIGPKSAYSLVSILGVDEIIKAVHLDAKATLTKVPGLGAKSAAQIMLDLNGKIDKIKMYSDMRPRSTRPLKETFSEKEFLFSPPELFDEKRADLNNQLLNHHDIMSDAIMACKELGFKEDKIIPIAQKILNTNQITRAEQLIHLVLKEV